MIELYILAGAGALITATVARGALKAVWRQGFRAKTKGYLGERKVRRVLKGLSRRGGRSKNDILVPGARGTSQIDHLLITRHGLFVIETKNYSGFIQGSERENMWRQYFPDGKGAPRDFYNPILQNKGHICALRALFPEYKNIPMHSIVLFPGRTSFPELPGVYSFGQLKSAVQFLSSGEPVLSREDVEKINEALSGLEIKEKESRSVHNARAKFSAAGNNPQQIEELINQSAKNAVYVSPQTVIPPAYTHDSQSERFLLTDIGASLRIRGRVDTIDGFFEASKRREDGQSVTPGGNFDYFICPFTGDKFPNSEAINLYRGLWITYLSKNEKLVSFMKENNIDELGNSFRCKRTLAMYHADPDGFIASVKETDWYQNMLQKQQTKRVQSKKPLDEKMHDAALQASQASPAGHRSKTEYAR